MLRIIISGMTRCYNTESMRCTKNKASSGNRNIKKAKQCPARLNTVEKSLYNEPCRVLQTQCPSCHPTNSIKVLNATLSGSTNKSNLGWMGIFDTSGGGGICSFVCCYCGQGSSLLCTPARRQLRGPMRLARERGGELVGVCVCVTCREGRLSRHEQLVGMYFSRRGLLSG